MTQNVATDQPAPADRTRAGQPAVARAVVGLAHRWPTLVALMWVTLTLADLDDGVEFAVILLVAAVGYLAMTVLDRPRATWAVLFILLGAIVLPRPLDVDVQAVLIVTAIALVAVGLRRRSFSRPGLYLLQVPVAAIFIATGFVAVAVPPDLGRYLVAAGLAGHALWDAVHWRADRIVSRSFSEFCGVLDLVLAVGILVLLR